MLLMLLSASGLLAVFLPFGHFVLVTLSSILVKRSVQTALLTPLCWIIIGVRFAWPLSA